MTQYDTHELLAQSIGPACHEVRSPLAVVYGFARMLESADDIDPRYEGYIRHIVEGSQRLDELLDSLSRMGRIAAGRVHPVPAPLSVRETLVAMAQMGANDGRVLVKAAESDVKVKADEDWLRDAFAGIVEALCYQDGITVEVDWEIQPREAIVSFVPRAPAMVDTSPEKASIALALARMRVVAQGGALDGDAERVRVTLPRS